MHKATGLLLEHKYAIVSEEIAQIKDPTNNLNLSLLEYEAEMKAAKKLKDELVSKWVNLEETIAKREEDKSDEHTDMSKI